MSAQTIYIKLRQAGMSAVGACAMMGNMQKESGLKANNVQDGFGYADADYTARVDSGGLDAGYEFVNDSIGYGLCQWTLGSRKRKLLDFALRRGASIGDEAMQVDFCVYELQLDFPGLWQYLCTATGMTLAAARICKEYERPAVNNISERAAAGNNFYMVYGGMDINAPTGEPEDAIFHAPAVEIFWPPRVLEYGMSGPDVVALQGLLTAHGYALNCDGQFGNKTKTALMGFQAEKSGYGNGVADEATWAALTRR